jgi:hypothetical protein
MLTDLFWSLVPEGNRQGEGEKSIRPPQWRHLALMSHVLRAHWDARDGTVTVEKARRPAYVLFDNHTYGHAYRPCFGHLAVAVLTRSRRPGKWFAQGGRVAECCILTHFCRSEGRWRFPGLEKSRGQAIARAGQNSSLQKPPEPL